ncbi:cytochrome c biogenesis protein CcdA [Corynebacterium bovis]|uniref:Thioredoxin domain-containing protein n=1 Tax=Corynebacterium bovis TaxID=36808 RepID=A0A3R8QFE9_9CORY|nr:cytochrome c biogenesis protein CcdA [Corynebacterium bovis]RRO85592.1 hypothetical protein CXF48_10390 [Corynebacterium bovis]RRO85970.1 hypothetical protein CXF30_08370 [Corynebacterium bovis]
MWELVLIGLIGGAVTGVSPCILPVLPVVLVVSGGDRRRPFAVALGIAVSFAAITLLGTVVLSALGLPGGVLRWVGIALLVAVGVGMIVPAVGELLERPFSRLRMPGWIDRRTRTGGGAGGFGIGLALGAVYVPCAGPVLAAVTVAGATGDIGWGTVALTVAFAVGACSPLLFFALAGNRIGQRAAVVRRHRTAVTRVAGAVVLLLAVALAADAPARLQRALPDWTAGVQRAFTDDAGVRRALGRVTGGHGADGDPGQGGAEAGSLDACRSASPDELRDCGPAPAFRGLEGWFNTDAPVDPRSPGGGTPGTGPARVTLVDFWAYACINCQRANTHLTALSDRYRDHGLTVVGVHAPEYPFEQEAGNVRAAARDAGITYPVAQDNSFATWRAYGNRYWPAHYLVDHAGTVRQVHEGEGAYAETERLVRALIREADPGARLPAPVEPGGADGDDAARGGATGTAGAGAAGTAGTTGTGDADRLTVGRNPETYLGAERSRFHTDHGHTAGTHSFPTDVPEPRRPRYTLTGDWRIDGQSVTPTGPAGLLLGVRGRVVQVVASGSGTLRTTLPDGSTRQIPVPSTPGSVDLVSGPTVTEGTLRLDVPEGVTLYSFTFG